MAITPSDFSKIWASNADTPEYTFTEADYLKGWDFVGNLPPTRAQWNAMQKSTDEKMKYVFDNFGAPLTASTVADMTMQNRVYVYTGSEAGYTAGHWYYWNGSAWTDGGVYNSNTVQVDPTLTISGAAADAQATGVNINFYTKNNFLKDAIWQQGYYASVATLSNTSINNVPARICTQIEVTEDFPMSAMVGIINATYNYECGFFAEDGTSVGYKSGWQTTNWTVTATKAIKYIRINMRKSDNTALSSYNNEIGVFLNANDSLQKAFDEIETSKSELSLTTQKVDTVFDEEGWTYLDASQFELGSISGDTYPDSTIRMRSVNFIPAGGNIKIVCLDDSLEFGTEKYNANGVHVRSFGSYQSGTVVLAIPEAQFKFVVKKKTAPYPFTSYDVAKVGFFVKKMSEDEVSQGNNIRLNVMSMNCGHFNYGASTEYAGSDMDEKIAEWKAMIARNQPDIVLAQEMSQYFDAGRTVLAYDTLFKPLMPFTYFYAYGRVISKVNLQRTWQADITVTVDGTTYSRSAGCATIIIDGTEIVLCSAHLVPGYDATADAVREAEKAKLIEALADYDHVIIGGDFNASTDAFFDDFVTAGYSCANHGYFGTIETLPNESVDNIIVKGFTFYNSYSKATDKCTSDHYPIVANTHSLTIDN